jgi:hypothetical protein
MKILARGIKQKPKGNRKLWEVVDRKRILKGNL